MIINTTKPVRKQGLIVQDMGRESLIYSAEGKVIHVLNPTAKLIWELCDGTHTTEDMERELKMNFFTSKEHNVVEDIKEDTCSFYQQGDYRQNRSLIPYKILQSCDRD